MGFFSFFTRTKEVDYDTYLASLQTKIQARQAKLQQIKLRERRVKVLLFTYGSALYFLYVALWWFGVVSARDEDDWQGKAVRTLPVIGGPVLILSTRWLLRWFYERKEKGEESVIKHLLKKKQEKVEEIKKKTGYYSTRDLLEKYDEALRKTAESRASTAPGTPVKQMAAKGSIPPSSSTPARLSYATGALSTPQNQARAVPGTPTSAQTNSVPFPSSTDSPSQNQALQQQQQQQPQQPFPPQPPNLLPQSRSVMDKLADALLGVSPEESNPYNKYALICAKCYAHNGLVPKEQFDLVQYQCPRCGYFNPRRKSNGAPLDPLSHHRRVQSMHAPSPLRSFESSSFSPATSEGGGGDQSQDFGEILEGEGGRRMRTFTEEAEEEQRLNRERRIREGGGGGGGESSSSSSSEAEPEMVETFAGQREGAGHTMGRTRLNGQEARRRGTRSGIVEEDEDDKMDTE